MLSRSELNVSSITCVTSVNLHERSREKVKRILRNFVYFYCTKICWWSVTAMKSGQELEIHRRIYAYLGRNSLITCEIFLESKKKKKNISNTIADENYTQSCFQHKYSAHSAVF
jgi:hypothetical protein